jgi:eukaryotic-like serine/threonine-protein kinase
MALPNGDISPPELTVDYRPADAVVGRLPVALAIDSSQGAAEDLRTLLQRRLRFLFPLLTALLGTASVITIFIEQVTAFRPTQWSTIACALVSLLLAGLIWRRPLSLHQLRVMELALVGILATRILSRTHDAFWNPKAREAFQTWQETRDERGLRDYFNSTGCSVCLTAAIYVVAYGVCIPNPWRRCLLVVGFLWAIAPATWVVGSAITGLPWSVAANVQVWFVFLDLTFAAALAIYGSHRVETLRHEALQARRLGQYVLRDRLGGGGMGEVYLADHLLLRRPCAIKLIRQDRAGDSRSLQRFEREVQATATLTHPNTIQIFDYGHSADGTFYYVMEYLQGLTLEELVARDGPLPPRRAVHFLRQICGALREAHSCGLIHRDVKPSNVIICERGGVADVAKLLDFGLVLSPTGLASGGKLTHEGMVAGTPAYLSPEQAGGEELVDARADIYSVGAVAYFLLTGQPPFTNRTGMRMLAAHLYENPEPLSRRQPEVPADLEAIVLRCLSKKPEDRFSDVGSLDGALAASQSAM